MQHFSYKTNNTCSTNVAFDVDEGRVYNIEFAGGCNGNLKAIASLVDGMTVEEIEKKLKGNTCGHRDTSCADQLANAVLQAVSQIK